MIHEQDYPRPQLVRPDWQNLNGAWRFAFDDDNLGEAQGWYDGALPGSQTIRVPFTYETEASGIADQTVHCCVWYQRQFTLTEAEAEADQLLWLHFEGSDYTTQVWVNGQLAGSHRGGYSRFSFEIANLVQAGDNRLTVKVSDSLSRSQPRGKQRWIKDSFACWYVQTTGLWKTVWLEPTARQAIAGCKLTPDLSRGLVHAEVSLTGLPELGDESTGDLYLDTAVFFNETLVCRHSLAVSGSQLSLDLPLTSTAASVWGIQTWTPQNPALYDITFTLRSQAGVIDQAASYFGMREISIADGQVLLNGSPLYQRLILDQGYWENSGLTPPDEAALITDIERIQQLGYNGVRKHQKVEDERFLYWCDVKGLLVWSEFPAAYQFNDEAVDNTISEWMAIVRQNYNHPCIITWTPFNESWGIPEIRSSRPQQHFTEAVYHLTKAFDPMRPVIVNDGWIHTVSDIITLHDYEAEGQRFLARYGGSKDEIVHNQLYFNQALPALADGYNYQGQPIIISEFGGIALQQQGEGWGYGDKVTDEAGFLARFDSITTAIKELPYVCGYCYTQVSDVQQEVNGLMDMQRNFKVDPEAIREINLRPVSARCQL